MMKLTHATQLGFTGGPTRSLRSDGRDSIIFGHQDRCETRREEFVRALVLIVASAFPLLFYLFASFIGSPSLSTSLLFAGPFSSLL